MAHADPGGRNIEKNTWSKNKEGTWTLLASYPGSAQLFIACSMEKRRKAGWGLGTRLNSTVLESRRVLLLSSNPEFYLQRFRLQVVLNMDPHSNPRRGLKSAQEQEGRWHRKNERGRAWRAAETAEQRSKRLRKRRERNRARPAAQTAGERQATSEQRGPEERERRLQRMSTNQQERLAVETPPRREKTQFCVNYM